MRWTIRKKLTSIILIFVLVPIAFLGSHVYKMATRALEERIGQTMRIQASAIIDQIDRMLFERAHNVQSWAEEEIMLDLLTDDQEGRISSFLSTLKKQYGLYGGIIAADNAGKIVASSDSELIGKNIRNELWFKKMQATDSRASVESGSKLFQGYSAVFAAPVLTPNMIDPLKSKEGLTIKEQAIMESLESWKPPSLGTVAAWINWSEIINFVNSISILEGEKQSKEAYALLVSKEGLVLTQPVFDNRAILFREDLVKLGMASAKAVTAGQSGYALEVGRYGEKDFVGYAPSKGYRDFKGFGWGGLVFQNAAQALKPIRNIKYQTAAVSVLVVLAAGFVALLLATGVSRPIEKLAEFTRAVGRGDFSASASVRSKDEVGTLAASFNEMILNLKRAKNELISARDFTDNIIKSIADALVVLDVEGRIKSCNPAVRQMLGYEEKDVQGLSAGFLFAEETRSDSALMNEVIRGTVINREVEFKSKEGDSIPVLFSSAVLKDPLGRFQGAVLIARDMRQYKSLQSKFLEAQKMDAVGRLAGGVAHDFNNMLTVINGYSEDILSGRGNPDAIPRKVGEVLKAGRRATKLVAQLLSFSRRQTSKPTIVDINQVIRGLDKMLHLITGARIEIVVLPAQDLWPVKLDTGQFEQVLTNLTVNARDAMPNGGKLVIQTSNEILEPVVANAMEGAKPGAYAIVEVRDSGTGMTEEVKKRIFEPFFTTKPKGKGTGLGLATCFDFMKETGGFIDVQTELGKGTGFRLYFPKSDGKPQNLSEIVIEKDLPRGTETILLVEDEDLVREYTQRILSGQGYTVITAMSGEAALKAAEDFSGKIHLLITDVVMPGMDGRQLADEMTRRYPGIKTILMSGYVDDETLQGQIASGGLEFLQKPVMAGDLAVKIRGILDKAGAS